MKRQLEIGPGEKRLDGDWVTIDCLSRPEVVDYVCAWGEEPLPFADGSFDLVYASHVLEHVPWYQTIPALGEVWRILSPGGSLEVHVPDLSVLFRAYRERRCLDEHAEGGLNQELYWMHWIAERLFHIGPEHQWHKACFDEEHLRVCLRRAGFRRIERVDAERGPSHGIINLGMKAWR